ncbi:MAG: AAA family ATPase [Deinococcus-Thermus bacterium]|nr:AAA family ATPase [Deinococcota bacterium]
MYETHFGLREKPFSLLPDPRFLYVSRTHKVGATMLRYALVEQSGIVVLTGEVGTGKTTLVQSLLEEPAERLVVGCVTGTHAAFGPLMTWILRAFELPRDATTSSAQLDVFRDFLIQTYARGHSAVLIVDEAQNLDAEALEQLRMLSNLNSEPEPLLQLVLVGQPELRETLRQPQLRQFVQRIWIDHHLEALDREDTRALIRHRLEVAGGRSDLVDEEAAAAIHYFGRGLPRLINALGEMALLQAYVDDATEVGFDTVVDVVAERQHAGGLTGFAELPPDLVRAALRARIVGDPDDADKVLAPRWIHQAEG